MLNSEITLEEFLKQAAEDLEGFRKMWQQGQRSTDPEKRDLFPNKMPHGEWDEQLRCHLGG